MKHSQKQNGAILENGISFAPNFLFLYRKQNLKDKIKSFKFFKSQNKNKNHPRSVDGIKSLAEYRGKFIGERYAESYKNNKIFELMKKVAIIGAGKHAMMLKELIVSEGYKFCGIF